MAFNDQSSDRIISATLVGFRLTRWRNEIFASPNRQSHSGLSLEFDFEFADPDTELYAASTKNTDISVKCDLTARAYRATKQHEDGEPTVDFDDPSSVIFDISCTAVGDFSLEEVGADYLRAEERRAVELEYEEGQRPSTRVGMLMFPQLQDLIKNSARSMKMTAPPLPMNLQSTIVRIPTYIEDESDDN